MDLLGPGQCLAAGSGELPQVVPQLDSLPRPLGDLLLVNVLLGRQPGGQLADSALASTPARKLSKVLISLSTWETSLP